MSGSGPKHRAVVFEDDVPTRTALEASMKTLIDPAVVQLDAHQSSGEAKPLTGGQLSGIVKDKLLKPRPANLVVLDWDLSKFKEPITRELVRGLCEELSIPLAVYHVAHGQFGHVEQMQRWQESEITIDPAAPIKTIGTRCAQILAAFMAIEHELSPGDGDLGTRLRKLLQAPKSAEVQLDSYSWGRTKSLQVADRDDKFRFTVTATGYWIHNRLLQFPGVLLNAVACASYLGVDPAEFAAKKEFQAPFEAALYKGPFSELGPYWWTTAIDDVLAEKTPKGSSKIITGYELIRKIGSAGPVRCIEGHDGAGFYCIITKEPVCEEHSVTPSGWLPMGADKSRIHSRKSEELSAWLKL